MRVETPYFMSSMGHVVVLGAFMLVSALRPTVLVIQEGISLVVLPSASANRAATARSASPPAPERAVLEPKQPEPKPRPPEPKVVSPVPPDAQGTKPPAEQDPVQSPRGQIEPPKPTKPEVNEPAPDATPETRASRSTDSGSGDESSVAITGGALGAHAPRYLMLLRDKIASNWRPPAGVGRPGAASADVHFFIDSNGGVANAEIATSSGSSTYDRAALRSVFDAQPFPPLPEEIGTDRIGITLTFTQSY